MRFLETINLFGENCLIPINKIIFVALKNDCYWRINIVGHKDKDSEYCFDLWELFGKNEVKAKKRYE